MIVAIVIVAMGICQILIFVLIASLIKKVKADYKVLEAEIRLLKFRLNIKDE